MRYSNQIAAAITTLLMYVIFAALIHYKILQNWNSAISGMVAVLFYRSLRDGGRIDDIEGKQCP